MKTFSEALKDLPVYEFPKNLHNRIIRSVTRNRLINQIRWITIIIAINALLSLWHLWSRLIDLDSLTDIKYVVSGFQWSFSYLFDVIGTIKDSLPLTSVALFIVNTGVALYLVWILYSIGRTNRDQVIG